MSRILGIPTPDRLSGQRRWARLGRAGWGLASLLLATSAAAQLTLDDRFYDCRIIARSDEFPLGFPFGPPTMNAWGQVAFATNLDPPFSEEVRVGVGDQDAMGVPISNRIALASSDASVPGARFGNIVHGPVIEDSGRVIYQAQDRPTGGPPVDRIYRTRFDTTPAEGPPNFVVENTGANPLSPYIGLDSVLRPTGSGGGDLLFRANTASVIRGVFTENDSLLLADNTGSIQSVQGYWNDAGTSAYRAFLVILSNGLSQQIRLGPTTIIESTAGLSNRTLYGVSLAANIDPLVAYVRDDFGVPTDVWQLGIHDGTSFTPVIDSSVDPLDPFREPRSTSVNGWSEIAFLGTPIGDGETLLATDGAALWRVLCNDQLALFGRLAFFEYELSDRAINNEGQIAFRARTSELIPGTSDFRTFIVRADPTPGQGERPTDCSGLLDDTPCDDGDPESLSACSQGLCVGDPIPRPSSCVGLVDDTPCDDGVPSTPGFCEQDVCVSVPVPEPSGLLPAIVALMGWAARRARHGS